MNKLLKVTSAMTLALAALSMSANASTLDIDEAKNMTKRTKHLSADSTLVVDEAKNMTKRTKHLSAGDDLVIDEAKNMTKRTKHL